MIVILNTLVLNLKYVHVYCVRVVTGGGGCEASQISHVIMIGLYYQASSMIDGFATVPFLPLDHTYSIVY